MRVEILSLTGQPGPVSDCHLECGPVTVLVGQNDVGKSFLLEGISAALNAQEEAAAGELEMFVRVEAGALEAPGIFSQLTDTVAEEQRTQWPGHGGLDRDWLDEPLGDEHPHLPEDLPGDLRDALLATGETVDGRLAVMVAPVFAFARQVWLCAAPWERLSEDLRSRLAQAWPLGASQAEERPWRPLPVIPVAAAGTGALPEPVDVPGPADRLETDVADAIVSLARGLHCVDPIAAGRHEPGSTRWLLKGTRESVSVNMAADICCNVFSSLAQDVLPDFVADRYQLRVLPRAVPDIVRGQPVEVSLTDISSGQVFPIARAASGHKVWLHLAISEVASRVRFYAHILAREAELLWLLAQEIDGADAEGRNDAVELLTGRWDAVESAMNDLLDLLVENPESLTRGLVEQRIDALLREFPSDAPEATEPLFAAPRQRLYLIDEPEQRLHPALQRRAAAWLGGLMEDWDAQCVIATHALAFMDVAVDARVHEVVRAGPSALVKRVDMSSFDAHALLAREMGFDRGEMLARWNAFLFVEGLGDVAVLEELFGERLRSAGILLGAVHGHRHHAGLLEMQIILAGTSTPVAALLDGVSETEIHRIRADSMHRREMLNEPDERGTVARIVGAEMSNDRQIEILTIGEADIFDLLDEDAIREVCGQRFPGHGIALRDFKRAGGGNAAARKTFYWQNYGVANRPRSLRGVARKMRVNGARVDVLEDLIDRVERLSL